MGSMLLVFLAAINLISGPIFMRYYDATAGIVTEEPVSATEEVYEVPSDYTGSETPSEYEAGTTYSDNSGTMYSDDSEAAYSDDSKDYIVAGSARTYYEKSDFEDMTDEELRIARNEILARHGRKFKD